MLVNSALKTVAPSYPIDKLEFPITHFLRFIEKNL